MTVRLIGPNAAAFMADRRLELELEAGRDFSPPPAAGFAAMLERVSRVVVADGRRPRSSATTAETRAAPGGRLGRGSAAGSGPCSCVRTAPPPSRRAPAGASPSRPTRRDALSWRYTFYSGPLESRALDPRGSRSSRRLLFSGLWSWLRALSLALLSPSPRADRDRRPSRRRDHRPRGIGQDPPPAADAPWPSGCRSRSTPPRRGFSPASTPSRRLTEARSAPGAPWRSYREQGVHPLYTLKSLLGLR